MSTIRDISNKLQHVSKHIPCDLRAIMRMGRWGRRDSLINKYTTMCIDFQTELSACMQVGVSRGLSRRFPICRKSMPVGASNPSPPENPTKGTSPIPHMFECCATTMLQKACIRISNRSHWQPLKGERPIWVRFARVSCRMHVRAGAHT